MGMKKLKFLPLCTQNPRTTSFRVSKADDEIYKTINSVYFDSAEDSAETPESWFTNSAESPSTTSFSSDSAAILGDPSDVEAVIRGAQQCRNQRLFFEPGPGEGGAALVVEEEEEEGHVTVAVESEDPHVDFKRSMAEMVHSLGVRWDDFEALKQLLGWYFKVNEERNHGYILSAFVDLISGISYNNSSNHVGSSSDNNQNNEVGRRVINNKNDDDDDDDDDGDESMAASFSTAAAASLSSFASTAVSVSGRILLGEDSDHSRISI